MGSSNQQFSLRWNNYAQHIVTAFDNLQSEDELTDVTLSCEGIKIKAHKILLSACSSYFRDTFRDNPCKHPVIILKGVSIPDLEALVTFMYNGQVNVTQERLPSFLQTAELLQIKGLTDMNDQSDDIALPIPSTSSSSTKKRVLNPNSGNPPSDARTNPLESTQRPPTPKRRRGQGGGFHSAENSESGVGLFGGSNATAGPSSSKVVSANSPATAVSLLAQNQSDSNSVDYPAHPGVLKFEEDGDMIEEDEDFGQTFSEEGDNSGLIQDLGSISAMDVGGEEDVDLFEETEVVIPLEGYRITAIPPSSSCSVSNSLSDLDISDMPTLSPVVVVETPVSRTLSKAPHSKPPRSSKPALSATRSSTRVKHVPRHDDLEVSKDPPPPFKTYGKKGIKKEEADPLSCLLLEVKPLMIKRSGGLTGTTVPRRYTKPMPASAKLALKAKMKRPPSPPQLEELLSVGGSVEKVTSPPTPRLPKIISPFVGDPVIDCETGETVHPCLVCDKKYRLKSSLESHVKVHDGSAANTCSICGQTMSRQRDLKRHVGTIHRGLLESDGTISFPDNIDTLFPPRRKGRRGSRTSTNGGLIEDFKTEFLPSADEDSHQGYYIEENPLLQLTF